MTEDVEDFAVYSAMPDEQKRQICIDLLAEFGVHDIEETQKGELRHQCSLPLGGHTDRDSRSASINYRKLTFRCWVCGARGGLLWWIATNRGDDDLDRARDWLRGTSGLRDGLELPKLLAILDALFNPKVERASYPTYSEKTIAPWRDWPQYHPYLTAPVHFSEGRNIGGREIPVANLDLFKIGFCFRDADWHYYQRHIIPIFWKGEMVGWQARQTTGAWRTMLDPDDQGDRDARGDYSEQKFRFPPDFPRDRVLYGSDEAFAGREILVVESPMSVLRHAHHLPIAATMGVGVSDHQLPFLHRFDRVTFWMDNDPAGFDALEGTGHGKQHIPGLIERLRDYTEVRVVRSPWWKADPADLSEAEAVDLYRSAVPSVLWKRPDIRQLQWYDRKAV